MPDVDLTTLHNTIVARLGADMVATTVAAYPQIKTKLTAPAVLVDLEDCDPVDFGEDNLGLFLRFTAYCITEASQADAYMLVRNLALTVAQRIHQEEDFGLDVSRAAEIVRIGPDDFQPELQAFNVWAVEFTMGIQVSDEAYLVDPATAQHVADITLGDFDAVDIEHVMADGFEPDAKDTVDLPDQPKG